MLQDPDFRMSPDIKNRCTILTRTVRGTTTSVQYQAIAVTLRTRKAIALSGFHSDEEHALRELLKATSDMIQHLYDESLIPAIPEARHGAGVGAPWFDVHPTWD